MNTLYTPTPDLSTFTDPKTLKFLRRLIYEYILHCAVRLGHGVCRLEWHHWPGHFAVTRQHINRTLRELIARGIIEEVQAEDYRAFRPVPRVKEVPVRFQKCSADVPTKRAAYKDTCDKSLVPSPEIQKRQTASAPPPPEPEPPASEAVVVSSVLAENATTAPLLQNPSPNYNSEKVSIGNDNSEETQAAQSLASFGVDWRVALALVRTYGVQAVKAQVQALPSRKPQDAVRMLVASIRNGYGTPPSDTERRETGKSGQDYPAPLVSQLPGYREYLEMRRGLSSGGQSHTVAH